MVAAVLVVGDVVVRGVTVSTLGGDLASFGTALLAAALGCVAGLLVRRAAAEALLVAGAATWLAALDLVGTAQAERVAVDAAAWRPWLVVAEAGLVGAASVAATAAATVRDRLARRWRPLLAGLAVLGTVAIGVLAAYTIARPPDAGPNEFADAATIRASGRAALGFAAAMLVVALGILARAPLGRANARAAATGAGLSAPQRATSFARALLDELPGQASPARVAEQERARLAADIHAHLLPGLRRAARVADEAGLPDAVAADLHAALSDAETLMDARQSAVLEQFGLVAALELLAERSERRGVEVTIDLDEAPDPEAIPPDVARAAFRVALLALDNAVRHAHGTSITLRLTERAGATSLTVIDDGVGIATAGRKSGGRGLRDMASEARRIGAALEIVPVSRPGRGTRVQLQWIATDAGTPATAVRGLPAGEASVDA